MNERIEKLYGQSFVNENYVNVGPNGTELVIRFDPEKFAELIVRECYALVDYENKQYIKAQFKEIFGAEQ
jgi:hypothetical protein